MINAFIKTGTMWKKHVGSNAIKFFLTSVYFGHMQPSFKCITSKDKVFVIHDLKAYEGTGGTAAHIPKSGSMWRSVVSLKPRPNYCRLKETPIPIDLGVAVPQSCSGCFREKKIVCLFWDPTLDSAARDLVATTPTLSRLVFKHGHQYVFILTPIQRHPHVPPTKVHKQKFPIMQ
jgi:hypothetical protein